MVAWLDVNVRLLELGSARVLLVELLVLVRRVAPRVPLVVVLQVLAECLPLRQIRLVLELRVVGRHGWRVMSAAPVVQDGAERVLLGFVQALLQLLDRLVVREKRARSFLQLGLQQLDGVLLRVDGVRLAGAISAQLAQLLLEPSHSLLLLHQLLLQRCAVLLQLHLLVFVLLSFFGLGSQLTGQSLYLVRLVLRGQIQLLFEPGQVLVLLLQLCKLCALRGKGLPYLFQGLL